MEGKRKEKVTLNLCSACWQMSASAYPYGCFHYLEPQPDFLWLLKETSQLSAALLWAEKPKGTSKIVLAYEAHTQQMMRADQARVPLLN